MLHTVAQRVTQAMAALHKQRIRLGLELVGRHSVLAVEAAGQTVGDIEEIWMGIGEG